MSITSTASPSPNAAYRILDSKWDGKSTFTVPEVAEILRISVWSAWQAVNAGEIPTIRIGKRRIVARVALERLLSGVA
jgi:Helix-turn-helix domain